MSASSLSRHNARKVALAVLFAHGFAKEEHTDGVADTLKETLEINEVDEEYAQKLVQNTREHQENLDQIIHHYAPDWEIEAVDPIDLNCLRIALYELIHEKSEIPMKVAIDEAIELAKEFGSNNSGSFINGVLGSYIREKYPDLKEDLKETEGNEQSE